MTTTWNSPKAYAQWAIPRWADVDFDTDEGRKRLVTLVAQAFASGQRHPISRRTLSPSGSADQNA